MVVAALAVGMVVVLVVVVVIFCSHSSSSSLLCTGKLLVLASDNIQCASIRQSHWLMLCRKTGAVYCKTHTEHINTLCGQNSKFLMLNLAAHIVHQ